MCDILTNLFDIEKCNLEFKDTRIVYIPNFIKDEISSRLVQQINKDVNKCKIKQKDSIINGIGQYDIKNNNGDNIKIIKKHSLISGNCIEYFFPDLYYYYNNCLANIVSKIVGCRVYPINDINTINNSILIYENIGDSVRWHTDQSHFSNKKVYTLLIYLYNDSSQQLCYIEYNDINRTKKCLPTVTNSCIILEHFTLEHMVTPIKSGEKKIAWAMVFAEDVRSNNPISYTIDKIKNFSYLELDAFNMFDYLVIIVLFYCIYLLYYSIKK